MKRRLCMIGAIVLLLAAICFAVTGSILDTTGVQISAIRGTSLAAQWALIDAQLVNAQTGATTHTKCTFDSAGIASTKTSGGGAATGTGGNENLLLFPEGMFEYHILGTQTILQPAWVAATGLNIAMDQADNDGVELTQGIDVSSKHAYTVGTDGAVYFKVEVDVADITGTDDFCVGWRKAEAYQNGPDAYDEWAAFNTIQGVINLETELNGGGTTTTDTTLTDWADGGQHTLQVNVSATGAVTYLYDGAAPTVVAAFSFDSGEVIVPFLLMIQHGDLTEVVDLVSWEVGPQY